MSFNVHKRKRTNLLKATVLLYVGILKTKLKLRQNQQRRGQILKPSNLRDHVTFSYTTRMFSEYEFRMAYRMSRTTFKELLSLVSPLLWRNKEMGRRAGRPTIPPDVRLAVCIRMMTGSSVWDCMAIFAVGRSTVYHIFRHTRWALHKVLKFTGLPESFTDLSHLALMFQISRSPVSPLPGCVGALDGISIKIRKPADYLLPSTFYCRKGFYALPVQALVDADYRFLHYSAKCCGSTHDSLAHAVSALGQYLEAGNLPNEFWIAGDEAYTCTDSLITPVPSSQKTDPDDSFNYHHSSLRMHVEQSFGMLVRKWPLLMKMEFGVTDSARFIGLAMKLHNFCIDHGDAEKSKGGHFTVKDERVLKESTTWFREGKHQWNEEIGRRGQARSTAKRDMLVEIIKSGGFERPPVSVRRFSIS